MDDRLGHSPKYHDLRASINTSANALNTSDLDLSSFSNIENVQLEKGPKGLGFAVMDGSITGQSGIFIKTVTPGGPAATVSSSLQYQGLRSCDLFSGKSVLFFLLIIVE